MLVLALASPSLAYRRPGETRLVSLSERGQQTKVPLSSAWDRTAISADGRFVAFTSAAPDLVLQDTNLATDVFLRDRRAGTTRLVSIAPNGMVGSGVEPFSAPFSVSSTNPAISASGRYVAFTSWATNLVPGDTNQAGDVFVRDMKTGTTRRVSVSSKGAQAKGADCGKGAAPDSRAPSMSTSGRYVLFVSCASNLVPGDSNHTPDAFVHDMKTGRTFRVTKTSQGKQVTFGPLSCPQISGNGRFVAYDSADPNIVAGDTNGTDAEHGIDTFEYDIRTGHVRRVSVASDGTQGTIEPVPQGEGVGDDLCEGGLFGVTISADGRYVGFWSDDTNLVPNDQNGVADMFVHDRVTGRTTRVDISSDGSTQPNDNSYEATISPDGRYIAYTTLASNMYPNDPQGWNVSCGEGGCNDNSAPDVFVYDLKAGSNELVSIATDGTTSDMQDGLALPIPLPTPGALAAPTAFVPSRSAAGSTAGRAGSPTTLVCGDGGSGGPAVSPGGRFVSFFSVTSDLVPNDLDCAEDVFVRDRGPLVGVGGAPLAVAGDASFSRTDLLARADPAGDVAGALSSQGADLVGATLAYRPQYGDVFVREELRSMPSVSGTPVVGDPGMLYGLDLTASGVRYEVRAQRIPGPDYDAAGGASFGVFRLGSDGLWTHVATIRGGYGTTGDEVVFSLPLRDIGLQAGGRLGHLEAFTALGSFDTGALRRVDEASA